MRRLPALSIIIAGCLFTAAGVPLPSDTLHGDYGKSPVISHLSLNLRGGYAMSSFRDDILESTLDVSQMRTTHFARSIHLHYSFSFAPGSRGYRFFPGLYQGAGISASAFGQHKRLGVPAGIYALQGAPVWNISSRLSLDYEWNFGVSTGWHKCDGETAKSNLIVGSMTNACINLGALLTYRISDRLRLRGGLEFTHYSNGNTSYPNPGVNIVGARLGLVWDVSSRQEKRPGKPHEQDTALFRRRHLISYDLTAYGAWRKRAYRGGETPVLLNGHFAVAGLRFAPMAEICRFFRAGLSADIQWDDSSDLKPHHLSGDTADDIRFSNPPFWHQVSWGVSANAELSMPYFAVGVGMGINAICPEESRGTYQIINLKTFLTRSLALNVGYQLRNFHSQSNLMLGLCYTFRSNRPPGFSLFGR